MDIEGGEVADLAADEIGAQELARIMPGGAVGGEDAMAKKRDESVFSALSQAPTFEIQG